MKRKRGEKAAQKAIERAAGLAAYTAAAEARLQNMARLRAERLARGSPDSGNKPEGINVDASLSGQKCNVSQKGNISSA
jgi:hypothetical protein